MKANGDGARANTQGTAPAAGQFLTVKEVAARLRVSEFTTRRWIWDHKLKAHLFGNRVRIAAQDLAEFISGNVWSEAACLERTARPRAGRRKVKAPGAPATLAPEAGAPQPAAVSESVSVEEGAAPGAGV